MGAQIMARAGYDPRADGQHVPDHPEAGRRQRAGVAERPPESGQPLQAINREAEALKRANARGAAGDIEAVHARLGQMPPALTSRAGGAQAQQRQRKRRAGRPSGRQRPRRASRRASGAPISPANFMRISVPANWQQIGSGNTVTYAPEGGYVQTPDGHSAFTHGIEIGVTQGNGGNLQQSTEQLLQSFARTNPDLRRQGGYSRATIGGRQGLTATLSNVSEVTRRNEAVNLSTVQLQDGTVLFMIGVAPQTRRAPT